MVDSKGLKIVAMILIVLGLVFSMGSFSWFLCIVSMLGVAGIVVSTLPRSTKMKWITTPILAWIAIYLIDIVFKLFK